MRGVVVSLGMFAVWVLALGRERTLDFSFGCDVFPVLTPVFHHVRGRPREEQQHQHQHRRQEVRDVPLLDVEVHEVRGHQVRLDDGDTKGGHQCDHPCLEEPEGYLPIPSRLPENELFALRVHGNSMRDAAILAGDIVVVRKQPSAASGDIVVALVGDEATVKRLRKRGRRVELVPENPDFEIIVPSPSALVLLGKVIEVRRYLEPLPS